MIHPFLSSCSMFTCRRETQDHDMEIMDVFRNEGFKPNDGEFEKHPPPQCTVNGILVPQSRIKQNAFS